MTRNTAKASANAQAIHPTTKSHCPAGAGIISSSSAPEGSHTPPQACAARAHDPALQQASGAQAAQPAEGYKHLQTTEASTPRIERSWHPSAEYRYFVWDAGDGEFAYFKSAADRDLAAKDIIGDHLDDAWSESVQQVMAGEITHLCAQTNVYHRPDDEHLDDEDFDARTGQYWGDFDTICNYELQPMQPIQPEPPIGIDSEGGSHD
ncbi:hypothetical protein [Halopseudomonas laoshanensis]|uniref:hypothetical protein n=1 Tax=Halopseudomonas laoshanensis TaxID=2268758 RepID=UPI003734FC57